MKVLLVYHPALPYSLAYMRLDPIGLLRVGGSLRAAGHDVRLVDLQVSPMRDYHRQLTEWRPDVVAFSLNFLAMVPDVIELAKTAKRLRPGCFVFVGGHCASFIPDDLLAHSEGALDCVLRGEGEFTHLLVDACKDGDITGVPGVVTRHGWGPSPMLAKNLDGCLPARDLIPPRLRRKYYFPHMEPIESVEFSRGCPWDCTFCSAWTFYGRSYRKASPERIVEDLRAMHAPNVFIVDDVAFVHPEHGMAIADAIERSNIRKNYLLETRADVFVRNREVFERWVKLGLKWVFFGFEGIDDESLRLYRKRVKSNVNFEALEITRQIGVPLVVVNVIADPSWDERDFERVRDWGVQVPEHLHITVATPYPGTETWYSDGRDLTTTDYRLFDTMHAVVPTRLPLFKYYEQLSLTQKVINQKHFQIGPWQLIRSLPQIARYAPQIARYALRHRVNGARERYRHHHQPVQYHLRRPERPASAPAVPDPQELYVHMPVGGAAARHAPAAHQPSPPATPPIALGG